MATSSTKYMKVTRRVVISRSSNYADPIEDYESEEAFEITRYKKQEILAVTSAGTTVDLSEFGTIKKLTVRNLDSTNSVTVTCDTAANSAVDNILTVAAGQALDYGHDVTPGSDVKLIASGSNCECILEVFGTA